MESPRVVNVILPEHRGYFVQHLGYFLTTFLLLAFIVVAIIVLTRRRKKRGLCAHPGACPLFLYLYMTTCFYFRLQRQSFEIVFVFSGLDYDLRRYDE